MIPAINIHKLAKEKAELSLLKTLIYFDIFNYPLSEPEIKTFLNCCLSGKEFNSALYNLVCKKIVFKNKEFYSLHDSAAMIERRLEGNLRAKKLLPKAINIGAFIYRFPYVRSVAISGSLSKNYADKNADIDFFIITKANRLWIARTFLHLFKKITFLFGRQHFYCMNYFIDEKALLLHDQNIYSATEIVTLIPAAGTLVLNDFLNANAWTKEWLPGYEKQLYIGEQRKNFWLKKILENCFNGSMGNKAENFLFKWTTGRWQKKGRLGQKNLKGKVMNLVTGRHFSKSDPGAFQQKIISMYENRIDEIKNNWPCYFD